MTEYKDKITKINEPTVAIVGRTNVGKSTLFNRLLERPKAMVSPIAGTTRDRNYGRARWRGAELIMVDTGGLEDDQPIARGIRKQADIAITKADLIFFLVDMKEGVMPQDLAIAKFLKKIGKPIVLVGNKADSLSVMNQAENREWLRLNFGKPFAVSAASGAGTGDLLDRAFELLKIQPEKSKKISEISAIPPIRVAIVGKPNAGKSSLVNALLGEERVLVSEIPFTTREPQDTILLYGEQPLLLIDTVGMRKRARVEPGLEKIGVDRSLAAMERADVIIFVTEAQNQMTVQDKHLAQIITEKNTGLIIIANKWDLVKDKGPATPNLFIDYYRNFFPSLDWAPILFISAKTGEKVQKIFETILIVKKEREKFLSQDELNNFLNRTLAKHRAVIHRRKRGGARPLIKKILQIGIRPPSFQIVTTSKERIPEGFIKYIERHLRESFGFIGTPIRMEIKQIKISKDK
jgi:GTP-binding protein